MVAMYKQKQLIIVSKQLASSPIGGIEVCDAFSKFGELKAIDARFKGATNRNAL